MDAQRVPPSAWRTSQSRKIVCSPSALKSTTPRSARPMRRWISTVRPSGRPLLTSRCLRSPVEAGSIPYSAVTQPRPLPGHPPRDALLRGGGADHARLAGGDQRRAGRRAHEPRLDRDRAQRARAPARRSARGSRHGLRRAGRRARRGRAASAGSASPSGGTPPCRPCTGSGSRPPAEPAGGLGAGIAASASPARARPGGRAPRRR